MLAPLTLAVAMIAQCQPGKPVEAPPNGSYANGPILLPASGVDVRVGNTRVVVAGAPNVYVQSAAGQTVVGGVPWHPFRNAGRATRRVLWGSVTVVK